MCEKLVFKKSSKTKVKIIHWTYKQNNFVRVVSMEWWGQLNQKVETVYMNNSDKLVMTER